MCYYDALVLKLVTAFMRLPHLKNIKIFVLKF